MRSFPADVWQGATSMAAAPCDWGATPPGVDYGDVPGLEVAGQRASDGQRVAGLLTTGVGGYAEYAAVPDELAVPIPDGVEDAAAIAVLVQGLTSIDPRAIQADGAYIVPGNAADGLSEDDLLGPGWEYLRLLL